LVGRTPAGCFWFERAPNQGRRAIVFFQEVADNQPTLLEVLGHGSARIGLWVLNVRPIDVGPRKVQVRLNRFGCVVGVTYSQPTHDVHLVPVNVLDCFQSRVLHSWILHGETLDRLPKYSPFPGRHEDIAKASFAHEGCERFSMIRNGSRHGLDCVVELVESRLDD